MNVAEMTTDELTDLLDEVIVELDSREEAWHFPLSTTEHITEEAVRESELQQPLEGNGVTEDQHGQA